MNTINPTNRGLVLIADEMHTSIVSMLEAIGFLPDYKPDIKRQEIIDTIGNLSLLYKYATIAYVGGGFTKSGIHNVLEAAVYGKAVITGPAIEKFREAVELKILGGLFTIETEACLKELITTIDDVEAGKIAEAYVLQNSGSTNKILLWVQENLLLTKE